MPTQSTLKAVFWTMAAIAVVARVPMARNAVFGQ